MTDETILPNSHPPRSGDAYNLPHPSRPDTSLAWQVIVVNSMAKHIGPLDGRSCLEGRRVLSLYQK